MPAKRLLPPQVRGSTGTLAGKQIVVFQVEPAPTAVMVTGDGFPYRSRDQVVPNASDSGDEFQGQSANARDRLFGAFRRFYFLSDCASFTASATPFSAAVCFTFARSSPLSDFKAPRYCP